MNQEVFYDDKEDVYSEVILDKIPKLTLGIQFRIPLTIKCVKGPAFLMELGIGSFIVPHVEECRVERETVAELKVRNSLKATIRFADTLHRAEFSSSEYLLAQTKPFGLESLQKLMPVIATDGQRFEMHYDGQKTRYRVENAAVLREFVVKCVAP